MYVCMYVCMYVYNISVSFMNMTFMNRRDAAQWFAWDAPTLLRLRKEARINTAGWTTNTNKYFMATHSLQKKKNEPTPQPRI